MTRPYLKDKKGDLIPALNVNSAVVFLDDFDDIAEKLKNQIQNTPLMSEPEKTALLESIEYIQNMQFIQNDSQGKMQVLANALLREYGKRHSQESGKLIRDFLVNEFKIKEIPQELIIQKKLNLKNLLLENSNRPRDNKLLTREFCAMLGQKYSDLNTPTPNQKTSNTSKKPGQDISDKRLYIGDKAINISEKLIESNGNIELPDKTREILSNYFDFENNQMKFSSFYDLTEKMINDIQGIPELQLIKKIDYQNASRALRAMMEKNPDISDASNMQKKTENTHDSYLADVNETAEENTFGSIAKDFNIEIKKSNQNINTSAILDSVNTILSKKSTNEEKIEIFADMLIHKYVALKNKNDKESDLLANSISSFCKKYLGITLPESVAKNEHLNLASILLKNLSQNEKSACVEKKFGTLINNENIVDAKQCDEKTKFMLELINYKSARLHQGDTYFSLLFQREKYLGHAKINAVKKLIEVVKSGKKTMHFTNSEMQTLNDGELGKIIKKYSDQDFMPNQMKSDIKSTRSVLTPKVP